MPSVIRAIMRLQDADDANLTLTNGYMVVYDSGQGKFVTQAIPGGGSPGGGVGQVQYYGSGGVFAGHSGFTYNGAGILTVSTAIVVGAIKPPSDSTASLKIKTAADVDLIIFDTTNKKVDVRGDILSDRYLASTTNIFLGSGVAGNGNLAHTTASEGWYNVALGVSALKAITTGYGNMAIGSQALLSVTTGYGNMAIGRDAMTTITTGASNVGIGASAGNFGATGFGNVAIGSSACISAGSVNYNVAIGYSALSGVTNNQNVAIGQLAGTYLRNGIANVMIGNLAGQGNANYNVDYNTLIGHAAGLSIASSGSNNTLIGYQAGDSITSGAGNIIIGYNVDTPTATTSNFLNIGNLIYGLLSAGKVGVGVVAPNSALDVLGTVQMDGLRIDVTPTSETVVCTHTITFSANGTDYKIPCAAA